MTNYLAGDLRRAGLAIKYHALGDIPALTVITDEAAADKRVTELLQAVCVLYSCLAEVLLTPIGIYSALAEIDNYSRCTDDLDLQRAATWILACGRRDVVTMNRVIHEVKHPENRIAQLVYYVIGIPAIFLGPLKTRDGIHRLENLVDRLLKREHGINPDEAA